MLVARRDVTVALTIALAELPVDENGFVFRAIESYDPPTRPLDENGQGEPYAVYGWGTQLVELEGATCWVPAGWSGEAGPSGTLRLEREA